MNLQDLIQQKEKAYRESYMADWIRATLRPTAPAQIEATEAFLRESLKEAYEAGAKNTLSSHWFATAKDGTIDITASIDLNKQALLSRLIQEVEGMYPRGRNLAMTPSDQDLRAEGFESALNHISSLLKAKLNPPEGENNTNQ